jgi:hypothetical protein
MSGAMTQAIVRTWWRFGWACRDFAWITGYRRLFWRLWWLTAASPREGR